MAELFGWYAFRTLTTILLLLVIIQSKLAIYKCTSLDNNYNLAAAPFLRFLRFLRFCVLPFLTRFCALLTFLRFVYVEYHAKSGASSLKIERDMLNLVFGRFCAFLTFLRFYVFFVLCIWSTMQNLELLA